MKRTRTVTCEHDGTGTCRAHGGRLWPGENICSVEWTRRSSPSTIYHDDGSRCDAPTTPVAGADCPVCEDEPAIVLPKEDPT